MFDYKVSSQYVEDCKKIQKYLKPYFGEVPLIVCEALWDKFSSSWSAGWLYTDPEILSRFREWLIEDLDNWEVFDD